MPRTDKAIVLDDENVKFVADEIARGNFGSEGAFVNAVIKNYKVQISELREKIEFGLADIDAGRTYAVADVDDFVEKIMNREFEK